MRRSSSGCWWSLLLAALLGACGAPSALQPTPVPPTVVVAPTEPTVALQPPPTSASPTSAAIAEPAATSVPTPGSASVPTAAVPRPAGAATTDRLYFLNHDDQLAGIAPDGHHEQVLTRGFGEVSDFTFSPDHRQVAAVQADGDTDTIVVMNSDGSNIATIVRGVPAIYMLTWSPDATRLAFVVIPELYYKGINEDIYVVDVDGSTMRQLTSDPLPDVNPVWSPDGTQIAFERGNYETTLEDNPAQVFVMNADGSEQRSLVPQLERSRNPVWSADGQQITFDGPNPQQHTSDSVVYQTGTFTVNSDGSQAAWNGPKPALYMDADNNSFTPSPDGGLIAFVHTNGQCQVEECTSYIYVAQADGSAVHQLTFDDQNATSSNQDQALAWSPDGTTIAFQRYRDSRLDLYTIDVDGTNQQRVTSHTEYGVIWLAMPHDIVPWPPLPRKYDLNAPGTPLGWMVSALGNADGTSKIFGFPLDGGAPDDVTDGTTHDYAPAWSADGSRLAFLSARAGGSGVYVELADGTFTRVVQSTPDAPITRVAWSPDGTRLVYDRNCALETVRVDGSDPRTLLAPADGQDACFTAPSYAPDGTQVVFAATVDSSRSAIFTINSDGGSPTQRTEIIPIAGSEHDPVFSPDGTKIAFASQRNGRSYIYLAAADGSNPQRLTQTAPAEFHPTWSPDSNWIAFSTPDAEVQLVAVSLLTGEQFALDEDGGITDPAWQPTPRNQ